jgi:hypothetical protein
LAALSVLTFFYISSGILDNQQMTKAESSTPGVDKQPILTEIEREYKEIAYTSHVVDLLNYSLEWEDSEWALPAGIHDILVTWSDDLNQMLDTNDFDQDCELFAKRHRDMLLL